MGAQSDMVIFPLLASGVDMVAAGDLKELFIQSI